MDKKTKTVIENLGRDDNPLFPLMFYLMCRSEVEKVPFELEYDFFQEMFDMGVREFFGVHINDEGKIIRDDQEPRSGFHDFVSQTYEKLSVGNLQ